MQAILWVCALALAFCARAVARPEEETMADIAAEKRAFEQAEKGAWREVFADSCAGDWTQKWTLDGKIGTVRNTPEGMELRAGPEFRNNAHHMVLWTKDSFRGDLKIEYEFTRLDAENRAVNIIYIQATGSGKGPYATDLAEWAPLREKPAMSIYFDHLHTYHISYAAFPQDYIRLRRYMPEQQGLDNTDILPEYKGVGMFGTGVANRFTIVKRGQEIALRIANAEKEIFCHWRNDKFPPVEEGRIGLRLMFTRASRYKDFRVAVPGE